jgi:hypothetical protein
MPLSKEARKEVQDMMAYALSDAGEQNSKFIEVITNYATTNQNILHAIEESNRQMGEISGNVAETAKALNNGLSTKIGNIDANVAILHDDHHAETGAIPVLKEEIRDMKKTMKSM